MKSFDIVSNGQALERIRARDGRSALKKFRKGLLSTGFYEYGKLGDGSWELSASYGRYYQAKEVR